MPELVARSDQAVTAPRRRPARSKAKSKRAARRRFLPAFILARPGRAAACAVVAAILTGIVLNAAFFQKGRHPAPLFATAPTVQPRAAHVLQVPVPAPRPAAPAPSSSEPLTPPAAIAPPPPAHAAVPMPTPRAAPAKAEAGDIRRDAIGAFLKGEGGTLSPDRVTAAQKALMHVGYVLRADGILGGGTRKAVEQFQRDNDLSVTGELNARTLRELTAQSGVVIP